MAARPLANLSALSTRAPLALAWLVLALAALWCVWMLVGFVWALLTPLNVTTVDTAASFGPTVPAKAPVQISRLHLFGNGHANQIRRQILEAGQATQLQLTLHGTVAAAGDDGYALIADAHGTERSYRVGDEIQQGVKLRAVYPGYVVLDHDGRNERLELPRVSLASAEAVRPLPRSGTQGTATAPAATPGATATPIYVAPRLAHGRVDWQELQQSATQDPDALIAKLQLQPVFEGTQLRGVRLGGGAANPLLSGTGLHADDVVTAVNGIPLDSVARGQQLFKALEGASQVRVTVLRDGSAQTLDINLSQSR